MLIIIAGAPATGKTTITKNLANHLQKQFNNPVFCFEVDKIRDFIVGDEQYFIEHQSLWFDLILNIVDHALKKTNFVILEGLLYNIECFEVLKNHFPKGNFFLFECDLETCIERNSSRAKVLPKTELLELFAIDRPTYLTKINANSDTQTVLNSILKCLNLT